MLTAFNKYKAHDIYKNIYCSTVNKIFIKYKLINNDINIIVNREQRPATYIAGSQGDHVTAYAVLLQTICNILDGVEESNAPSVLYESISCFCENLEIFKFKSKFDDKTIDFITKLKEARSQIFPKNTKEELISFLNFVQNNPTLLRNNYTQSVQQSLNFIISSNKSGKKNLDIEKLADCIELSNKIIFSELVVELGEQILVYYNKQTTAALPKLQEYNSITGEGFRIKKAMLYLKLLNKLIQLKYKSYQYDIKLLINQFSHDCRNIIKNCFPQIKLNSVFNKKFNDFIKIAFTSKLHKINLDNIEQYLNQINLNTDLEAKKIGELFNDLFDFKQNKIRKIKQNHSGDKLEQEGQIVDNGTKIALEDPLNCLYEVTARHENFMFIAFNSLNNLSQEIKNSIIDGFHEKIIALSTSANKYDNNQGWGEWVLDTNVNFGTIYFTKADLDHGVQEFHNKHPRPTSYNKAKAARKLNITI